MNCPQCNQTQGRATSAKRVLAISCSCCGLMEVICEYTGRILSTRGPYRNERDLRRLERLIPFCRRQRRIPA